MRTNWFPCLLFLLVAVVTARLVLVPDPLTLENEARFKNYQLSEPNDTFWRGESENEIPAYTDSGKLIVYGRALIANTSRYLGPRGSVASVTNGMNCQNCHLEAGTRPFGNNFAKVAADYPQYRARNNGIQTIYGRINDCLERSLNGRAMDSTTREMRAMYAYLKWIGEGVTRSEQRAGTGLLKLSYLDRAADPAAGKEVYKTSCQSCHGKNGEGLPDGLNSGFIYPPLWGDKSYNDAAGLYRLGSFAGFIKDNMPFGTDYHSPRLSDEEAWDVAAFVNSQPRPHKDQTRDWAVVAKKPVDFPFGPYADSFPERQHKFGPFGPIKAASTQKKM